MSQRLKLFSISSLLLLVAAGLLVVLRHDFDPVAWQHSGSMSIAKKRASGVQVGGQQLYTSRCAACHGERAEGDRSQMTGALSSMPRWYLVEQLDRYRSGMRGAHPQDLHGQSMKAVAESLGLDEQERIVDFLVSLKPTAQQSTLVGDVERGRELYDVNCAMCHRYNAHGMVGFKSAPLNGQQDWYLLKQMEKFDQKLRGYHAADKRGHKMHSELEVVREKEERLAILAYISQLSETYPMQDK